MISAFPTEVLCSSHWDWLGSGCSPWRASRSRVGHHLTQEVGGLPQPREAVRDCAIWPRYYTSPMVFAIRRPRDSLLFLHHQNPGFQAQNWVAVWADTELAAGFYFRTPVAPGTTVRQNCSPPGRGAEAREPSGHTQQVPLPQIPAS